MKVARHGVAMVIIGSARLGEGEINNVEGGISVRSLQEVEKTDPKH